MLASDYDFIIYYFTCKIIHSAILFGTFCTFLQYSSLGKKRHVAEDGKCVFKLSLIKVTRFPICF